jgi:hypothetical protein
MATERIPQKWKQAVCRILRTGDEKKIKMTRQAFLDWSLYFPQFLWKYQLYETIQKYLDGNDPEGRRVTTMDEAGEVYEMIFDVDGRLMYTKINLTPEGDIVIIYSAHPPRKGDKL